MEPKFHVFLSYNRKDLLAVQDIWKALKEKGLRPWLDIVELRPGRPWEPRIEEVISTVPAAAVFVGANGMGPWQRPEMRACLGEFARRKIPLIPVLLPGAETPRLPLFLQDFTWVDLREGMTPAGIDHLIWGITVEPADVEEAGATSPQAEAEIASSKPEVSFGSVAEIARALAVALENSERPARRKRWLRAAVVAIVVVIAIVVGAIAWHIERTIAGPSRVVPVQQDLVPPSDHVCSPEGEDRIVPHAVPSVISVTQHLANPDGRMAEYIGAMRVEVPLNERVCVFAGFSGRVENVVAVHEASGKLYQTLQRTPENHGNAEVILQPGQIYFITSWHKRAGEQGDGLLWFASEQRLRTTESGITITSYHQEGSEVPDAFIDVNVLSWR